MIPQPLPASPDLRLPPHPAGLGALIALIEERQEPLPLQDVRVRACIAGDCARTEVTQRFANPYDRPLEVVHLFPLPDEGAVVELELRAGDVVVRGECQERQQARQRFEQARAQGHRAALLEAERDDVHTLRVTRIPPGEAVSVRIVVVERLQREDGWMRWRFPTVIPPRYLPGAATHHQGPSALPATDAAPDADRLQPPLRLSGGVLLDLEVALAGPIQALRCAQHALKMQTAGGLRVAPAAEETCDRDFVLAFQYADHDRTTSHAWTDGAFTLVVVEAPSVEMPAQMSREAVFVIDISGSMRGRKLDAAKRALIAALHGLMPGDRFRLIAFDDRLERFPVEGAAPVSDLTLSQADAWVAALQARGGTEMLPAIQEALRWGGYADGARSVLFITDGQAWNEDQLAGAVSSLRQGARFFTLGIDSAVNSSLLRKLARVGGATCTLLSPTDDVEQAMAEIEAKFGSPVLEGLQVEGYANASLQPQPLFAGRPASLLVEGAPALAVVSGRGASGPWRQEVTPRPVSFPLGALWGRARVAAMQDRIALNPSEEPALRDQVLRTALRFSLASRYTAFVAVDESRVVMGELGEVVQPAERPAGWDMLGTGAPGGGGGPPPMHRSRAKGRAAPMKREAAPPPPPRPAPASAPPPLQEAAFAEEELSLFSDNDSYRGLGGVAPLGASAPAPAAPSRERAPDLDDDAEVADGAAEPEPEGGAWSTLSRMAKSAAPAARRQAASFFGIPASRSAAPEAPQGYGDADPAGELARLQAADGSFGGDVGRTAAALLALLLLGHTRRKGSRRRTVLKAAGWLEAHKSGPQAALALRALGEAERGQPLTREGWATLHGCGQEGALLRRLS
ncbi:MAG: VWA domain-containing protein [Alphaproteobacteria bacterium]|nr:VWA domain-containing protein [Alphaproteobacteria bacterium]